jgi:nucleoid DNA-binding protein
MELDRRVASSLGVGVMQVARITREFLFQLGQAPADGEDVQLHGFGLFAVTKYSVRTARGMPKRWRYALRFRPARTLRERVRAAMRGEDR